ncbi:MULTISPECIES: Csu type fimbrial protein [Novosphingobium]|uniref:Csu type fimbrial protein n=1 Tax=Novosphingobium TaxID=165696 RepID=UPI0022F24657|nr:spore coat U domain-containing protein [Novosphingobium resinovorum]
MPMIPHFRALALLLAVILTAWSGTTRAQTYGNCTVAASTITIGDAGSFSVAGQAQASSGAGGLSCSSLLTVATTSYIKVRVDSSTFLLTGPGGQTIPFTLSSASGGTALTAGSEADLSTTALITLFSGPGTSIPLYVRTTPTSGLAAGTYTGTVMLRWYFSICTIGALNACVGTSNSPGATRSTLLGPLTSWGTGVPLTVTVTLKVLPDCQITAPDLAFGTAPLVGSFSAVTRTISVRCSLNSTYTVGLGNGQNFSGTRRMRQGTTSNYLNYEIYRGSSVSAGRWGSAIAAERRSSASADSNPGIYDSSTLQGYTYRAVIDSAQMTPAAGVYGDVVIVDIGF